MYKTAGRVHAKNQQFRITGGGFPQRIDQKLHRRRPVGTLHTDEHNPTVKGLLNGF
jgi:hypothetical protein